MPLDLKVGDIIQTKKNHPCGGSKFEITRTGMDFRMVCLTCQKELWIDRPNLEKRIKLIEREGETLTRESIKR